MENCQKIGETEQYICYLYNGIHLYEDKKTGETYTPLSDLRTISGVENNSELADSDLIKYLLDQYKQQHPDVGSVSFQNLLKQI